jgi:hypothetical protein
MAVTASSEPPLLQFRAGDDTPSHCWKGFARSMSGRNSPAPGRTSTAAVQIATGLRHRRESEMSQAEPKREPVSPIQVRLARIQDGDEDAACEF